MSALSQETIAPFYEFGPFLVDTVKCVLTRDGEVVPLSLKAFEILLVLIQHQGQVLEKSELLKRVWPDTVVEENNLARHISALRKALEEQPNERRYILTIPGQGYRFVADVKEVVEKSETLNAPAPAGLNGTAAEAGQVSNHHPPATFGAIAHHEVVSGAIRRPARGLLAALAGLAVGIAAAGLAFFFLRPSPPASQPPPRKLWQLTFDAGLESEPTWSPDGRQIAYSSERGGNFDIWVQPVGEGNPVRVTTSPAHDWQPDWAPEGNRLVFRSERDGGGLYLVPVFGGVERRIADFGYRPRWSPDGSRILFYSSMLRTNTPEIPKVYLVGLNAEPPREVLSEFLSQFSSLRVAWHPDGQRLSVWGNHRQQGWGFWTAPIAGGAPVKSEFAGGVREQLREAEVSFTDFQWAPTGRALYFEGVSLNVRNLWKVAVEPRSLRWTAGPERLTTGTGLDTDLMLSPDGSKLAFTARTERTRIWSLPLDAAAGHLKGAGEPVTAAGIEPRFPDLTPDGQKLVYCAPRAGRWELWGEALREKREQVLIADDLTRFAPRWSRDGLRLAYRRLRPHKAAPPERAIATLAYGEGEERLLTTPGALTDLAWDWSADGQWLLGGSDRQSPGRIMIVLFPLAAAPHAETGMRVIASHPEENLYQARFSPGDRWISFCSARATGAGVSSIYVVPASGGDRTRITEGKYFDDKPRWSPDGRTLYFLSNRAGFFNLWGVHFDLESGKAQGEPFRVTSFDSPSQMILDDVRLMEMALSAERLILPIMEVSGGIWILENVGR